MCQMIGGTISRHWPIQPRQSMAIFRFFKFISKNRRGLDSIDFKAFEKIIKIQKFLKNFTCNPVNIKIINF